MTYTCPVCGYDRLEDHPERYEVCPCCGVEFDNDDELHTHEELRQRWIAAGMNGGASTMSLPPPGIQSFSFAF